MKFKEINKNGVFCWSSSRHESSLAIATTTQQFDAHFGTDCKLEIYDLDIQKSSEEGKLRASNSSNNTFNCIAWHPKALICGTQLKSLQVYNVEKEEMKLYHETDEQTSGFTCLDLNSYESNSFATGSDDGCIGVWDLDNKGLPVKTLTLSSTSAANEPINSVKWNKAVNSILAAASNSNVSVWDTRKSTNSGPIMRVHDNNATSIWGTGPQSLMIARSLVWSATQATTLILANSNDANPILQLWDLRYATCPINNFKGGHSRGIVSISWNKYDEELLLTAGKDNVVCLWNPSTPVNEEPLQAIIPYITNQWINEIEWCHWEPSLFAISSFDGNTTVYNLTQTNCLHQTNTKILESFSLNSQFLPQQQLQPSLQKQPILTKSPKWLRTPCRASWGFGGKLVTYNMIVTQTQTQPPQQFIQHILTLQQVVIDSELIQRADKLENALSNGNFMDYCHYKIAEHNDNENICMAWKLVSAHLENDPQKQRELLLNLLGFENYKSQSSDDSVNNLCDLTNDKLKSGFLTNDSVSNHANGADFFSQENISKIPNFSDKIDLEKSLSIDTSDNCLGTQINKGILNGELENVIKNCIQSNSWAEGILLCCFVSPEHTASTLRQYFEYCLTSKPESWSSLLWCLISAQTASEASDDEALKVFQRLVTKVDLKYWREVLAFIIRESDNWEAFATKTLLINDLANRLVENYVDSGQKHWLNAAIYCYIINADYINLSKFVPFGNRLDQIELSLILQKSTNAHFVANELTAHYAKLLAIEGKLELALKYIDEIEIDLKERIIGNLRPNSRGSTQTQSVAPRVHNPITRHSSLGAHNPITRHSSFGTSVPHDYNMTHQYTPSMPNPYNIPNTDTHNIQNPYSQPTAPVVPNVYPLSQQNPTAFTSEPYVMANYDEQQLQYQEVSPGWNDPPVITNSRHNSFSAHHSEPLQPLPVAPIFTPLAGNPMATSLPVEQNQSNANQLSQSRRQSLPPPLEPLSPQNQHIYDAFDRLLTYLQQNPNSQAPNMRRKLDDAKVKMETLRAKLAVNSQLSSNAISGLNDIANAINQNDFQSALQFHTKLVVSTTFGETAAFLPAIKVILHLAQQKITN